MKTIFRFLNAGAMTVAVLTVGAVAGFAQDECADVDGQNAVYTKFTAVYNKKTVSEMETALSSGKEFLEKYGACESVKEQADFVRPHVERIEKQLPDARYAEKAGPIFKRFDSAITSDNGDEIYAAGRELLAIDPNRPNNINILVPLGVAGLFQSYNNNMKHADDTIRYAKMATDKLKAGAAATKKNKAGADVYGALKYEYTKDQALDQLQFATAHLTYYAKKDQKGALPLYYEIAQTNATYKDDPRVYQTIGAYFASEVIRLSGEVKKLIDEQKVKPTDDEKLAMEPKIKEAIGLLNGTAERAMEYYSRAYKVAKSDTPAAKTYRDSLYRDLTILYEGRFPDKGKAGLDAYISSVTAKPLPNPTTPVTPVNDDPTTTTSAPSGAVTTKPVSSTAPVKSTVAKKGTRK